MPNLVSRLSSLHNTLTKRLALQERLLLLNGRLDLALSQVELRSSKAPSMAAAGLAKGNKNKDQHVTKYVEGESSDDESMEIEIEKGSDAESVEDIRLDGPSDGSSDTEESDVLIGDENEKLGAGTDDDEEEGEEDEDEDEDEDEEEEEEEDEDEDDDSDASDKGPRMNGLIDDEAEESWGSEEEEEEEEEY
jgi:U3 small nucleolar RNA-associated protein 5